MKYLILILAIVLASGLCKAAFVEDNDRWIGVDEKSISTMDEASFNKVIDKVEAIYKPVIASMGGVLMVERNWTDGTVNAYAQRDGKNYKVSMFGGLARHAVITEDGFMLVLCHEVGHHIGGAPKKKGSSWASNEGQSDYWSSLKCLKKVFKAEGSASNLSKVKKMKVPELVVDECNKQFTSKTDAAICMRVAMSGKSVTDLFADLGDLTVMPDFSTPSPVEVTATSDTHPAAQCRLDTYFAAALCQASISENVSYTDHYKGVCNSLTHTPLEGARPLCWYKPQQ